MIGLEPNALFRGRTVKSILVASSKGGVGKTTVVTNLAAQAAVAGLNTVIVDADPQQSSTHWAQRRAGLDSAVLPIDGTRKQWAKHVPDDAQRIIIDTPAGATRSSLDAFLDEAQVVIVPVGPSALDIEPTVHFLNEIHKHPRVKKGQLPIGLVVNRVKPWTQATQQAVELLKSWNVPVIAQMRDSQAYVMLAGLGRGLHDYHSAQIREHQADWAPLINWTQRARG
jgi:chromosome partitioning protein